jgi:hypothetical protein
MNAKKLLTATALSTVMALSAGASLAANGTESERMQLAQGTAVTPPVPAVGEQPAAPVEKAKPKKTKAQEKTHKKTHKKAAAPAPQ